jgi:prephenate dehydratase
MKVLIRGLNISDNKAKLISLHSSKTFRQLKQLLRKKYRPFNRTRFYILSNGRKPNDSDVINHTINELEVRLCMLGGKVFIY